MGDRACVNLVLGSGDDEKHGISLYTHWGGCEVAQTVAEALGASRDRWSDESYFARIFIDQFFKNIRDEETGGGVLPGVDKFESEYPRITVHLPMKLVFIGEQDYDGNHPETGKAYKFEEFIADPSIWERIQGN